MTKQRLAGRLITKKRTVADTERNDLERRYKIAKDTANKAESLVSRVR